MYNIFKDDWNNELPIAETFDEFMDKVNAYTISFCGMSTDEFDDYNYRECYDDGMDPYECAGEALENAGLTY